MERENEMSTKAERVAWNMTKLAARIDPTETENLYVFEMAKDMGLALIDTEHIGCEIDQRWIFVPQKEWDKVVEDAELDKRVGIDDPEWRYRSAAEHWYRMSQIHRF